MKKFYDLTDAIISPSLLFQKYVKYQIFSSRILEHRKGGGITKFLVVGGLFFLGMAVGYNGYELGFWTFLVWNSPEKFSPREWTL